MTNYIIEDDIDFYQELNMSSNKDFNDVCLISNEPLTINSIRLPCNHIFKKDAILQWLNEESNKCPVCRKELAFKEKKIDISSNIVDISSNIVDTSSNIVDTSSNIVEDPISQIENLLLGAMSRRMVGYEMAPLSNYINEENSLLENEEMQRALYESLSKNN